MSATRLLLSCVAEDRPRFHQRVEILVGSARSMGGSLADSPILVNMVESVDRAFARRIEALDAEVRVVPRVTDGGVGFANKLRMLDVHEQKDFDVLLAVDCDIAVAEDPTRLVSADRISIVPADRDPLTDSQWHKLLDGLGLKHLEKSVSAIATGQRMYPYFNSGVIGVPRGLCAELLLAWTQALKALDRLWQLQPDLVSVDERFFTDQFALMAALASGLPWTAASPELNFGTHVDLHGPAVEGLRPTLLHYHREVDGDGFLFRPRCSLAEPAVDRVNRSRAQTLGIPYRGLRTRSRLSRARLQLERQFMQDAWQPSKDSEKLHQ
jgi:hypothetical protein